MFKRKSLLIGFVFFFSSNSAHATYSFQSLYSIAENEYKQKHFSNALNGYDRALPLAPVSVRAGIHYMKANCLMQLNQAAAADQEYASAEKIAPGSQTAKYCEMARANIKRFLIAPNTAAKSNAATSAQNPDDSDNEDNDADDDKNGSTASGKPAPGESGKNGNLAVSPATLELIKKQAAYARTRAIESGKAAAENERMKASNEARSLQARLERQAATPRNGSNEPVALTPAQMESIRKEAAQGSEQLKQIGEWKAQQRKQESEDKAEEIRRQAENLQSQLINYRPNINSDIKLNPVGTNLYIRNYTQGLAPVAPMKAQTKPLPSYKNATEGITGTVRSKQTALKKNEEQGTSVTESSSVNLAGQHSLETVKGQMIGKPKSTRAEQP